MSLISELLEKRASLSAASKYTAMNGFIYLGAAGPGPRRRSGTQDDAESQADAFVGLAAAAPGVQVEIGEEIVACQFV